MHEVATRYAESDMSSEDDKRKLLEEAASAADKIADEHRPTCGTAQLMRAISNAARQAAGASKGPAQVATPAYRTNWDTLFGKKQPVGQA